MYEFDNYYAQRNFGNDETTQLIKQIRCYRLDINAKTKIITIYWEECLISPTGAVMQVLREGNFTRFNSDTLGNKFDDLKNSEIGQGIIQMVEALDLSRIAEDLSNFPACLEQGYGL
jgi:hypothetical protein